MLLHSLSYGIYEQGDMRHYIANLVFATKFISFSVKNEKVKVMPFVIRIYRKERLRFFGFSFDRKFKHSLALVRVHFYTEE